MKKQLFFIAAIAVIPQFVRSQITSPSPYCDLNYTFGSSSPLISNVVIGAFTNPTGHCAQPGYIYYNNLGPISMTAGSSQTISVTLANYDLETALKGWIDFNNDQVFEPSEEIIYSAQGSVGMNPNITKTATFTVPANAVVGTTRMRIAIGWTYADNNNSIYQLDSCHVAASEYSSGETEDYDVSITSATGIENISHAFTANVFPNPASDLLSVELNFSSATKTQLKLVNMLGETVYENEGTYSGSADVKINTSSLARGVYFLHVSSEEGSQVQKVKLQ